MTRTPRSLRSALLPLVFRAMGTKRRMSSAEGTLAEIAELQLHPEPHAPPAGLARRVAVTVRTQDGWPIYTVAPRPGAAVPDGSARLRVLYTHGGTWIHEIVSFHWRLIAELVVTTGATVEVPIYPLAPVGTAGAVVPRIAELAAALVREVGAENVTLMGDSAGGTITLAAAMALRDGAAAREAAAGSRDAAGSTPAAPSEIVLIAAPIDLRFTDPMIERIAPSDPWLAMPGIRAAAELWRGELPFEDPRVSPAFGSLAGLGRITHFTGTHDIAHADAITLRETALREGHPHVWHREPNLLHVYPLLPIPEGARARTEIARIVARQTRMAA